MKPGAAVNVPPPVKLTLQRGATGDAKIRVEVASGYHINSNKPTDEYLIPVKLEWQAGGITPAGIDYPAPAMETFSFSNAPVSVYSRDFTITAHFRAGAKPGAGVMNGTLQYQACTRRMCLPPKKIAVVLPYQVQ
jgi:hypothetical protein